MNRTLMPFRLARTTCLCIATALVATFGHATAPSGRYSVSAVGQVDTVTDSRTLLGWQQSAPAVARVWADAWAACSSLGAGWRLPSVEELETLVDEAALNPAIDGTFSGTTGCYWTLTPLSNKALPSTGRFCVDFFDGRQNLSPPQMNLVRCVR